MLWGLWVPCVHFSAAAWEVMVSLMRVGGIRAPVPFAGSEIRINKMD